MYSPRFHAGQWTTTIESRSDFAQWAIERASAIVAEQGGNLALAARDSGDDKIVEAANALDQAVFDTLMAED
ncbi:hypothetical protein MRS75_24315 [Rhizobiaceae bacterium n36]|uniref:Uncharacterized protein n=1 Tax=Ferirhizobium litorale TaxID=2927786 RepID=A0AAE3QLC9_9HYPH|nr:hypothetical protein [Fererhizobium litorale]MDI7925173.1 hypothetical protein [Fererhizobium litorale]